MAEEKVRRRSKKRRSLGFLLAASKRRETNILAVLRDDPKFRWVFSLLMLAGLAVAIMLPKVWITTAKGIDPIVRVSGLDLIQTYSLMRSARSYQEAGKVNEALQSWASAIANNQGDFRAVRGLIQILGSEERIERRWTPLGIGQSFWLLQIGGTNQADVELVTQFYRKAELHELSIRLLGDTNRTHSPVTTRALALAYYETGRMDLFAQHWDKFEAELKDDTQLRLCRAAWSASAGPPAGIKDGIRILTEASKDRSTQIQALQLLLNVQSLRLDLDGFNATFGELQSLRADRLQDHVRHWLLLSYVGQGKLAAEKARAYAVAPQTVTEANMLLNAWNRLGVHDLAVDFARQQMPAFSNTGQLWLLIGRMLTSAQRWDDLRAVAVEMRNNPRVARVFGGYTYFLEGLAEHGLDHRVRAEENFRQMLLAPPTDTAIAFECGTTLQRLGYNESAQAIFKRLETDLGGRIEFWQRMAQSAHESRDADLLFTACEKAFQISPASSVAANNYAAALLITRRNPAEAVRLTVEVLTRSPDSRIARINHALALLQNGRYTEARRALDTVNTTDLSAMERSYWNLGHLECALGQNDLDRARNHVDQIEQQYLFPPQADWLAQARAKLIKKSA